MVVNEYYAQETQGEHQEPAQTGQRHGLLAQQHARWSMGGQQQTYEWAVRFPDMVKRAMPIAANARTPEHNQLFIDLHTKLLTDDPAFVGGFCEQPHAVHCGLRRHAEALALMGATARMFKEEVARRHRGGRREDPRCRVSRRR